MPVHPSTSGRACKRVPDERVVASIPRHSMDMSARFYLAVLHRLLSLGDPDVAIGRCRCENTRVVRLTPFQGVENVVPANVNASGSPIPHTDIVC